MADIRLDRTFWPVGHGAFYTEVLREGRRVVAVYDCGGKEKSIVKKCVDDFVRGLDESSVPDIDFLFISHFHNDHVNGVRHLLKRARVKWIILPQLAPLMLAEAYVYNAFSTKTRMGDVVSDTQTFIYQLATDRGQIDSRIIEVARGAEVRRDDMFLWDDDVWPKTIDSGFRMPVQLSDGVEPFWVYIPVNLGYSSAAAEQLLNELSRRINSDIRLVDDNGVVNWEQLQVLLRDTKASDIKDVYASVFGRDEADCDHNAYSMPVYSGPIEGMLKGLEAHVSLHCGDERDHWECTCDYNDHCLRGHGCYLACLYMGDFEAKNPANLRQLKNVLGVYYDFVGLQQVPHHFSPYNHNASLYKCRERAFGNINDHKDVSFCHSVYKEIRAITYERIILQTEKDDCCKWKYWICDI